MNYYIFCETREGIGIPRSRGDGDSVGRLISEGSPAFKRGMWHPERWGHPEMGSAPLCYVPASVKVVRVQGAQAQAQTRRMFWAIARTPYENRS